MAPQYPPFMFAYGIIADMIAKIQSHDIPAVFSHDFLRFKLGFSRESDRAFVALAKRTGLLTTEGIPTELYRRVRDPAQAMAAMVDAMRLGFPAFYAKHPNAHDLDRKTLAALTAEVTGLELGHANARAIIGTFLALKAMTIPLVERETVTNRRKVPERRKRW